MHSRSKRTVYRIFVTGTFLITGLVATASAVTVEDARQVATTSGQNATLASPRWKGWVHPENPQRMWLCYTNGSSSGNNVNYTADGGRTWSGETINPGSSGYLDYHVSLFGHGGDLYFTFPNNGINVRRIAAPAASNADRGPIVSMPSTSGLHRSNVMVDGNGRVWVFTRLRDAPGENVRYHYSDDQGRTWTHGMAVETGTPNVRVGSMPYVDGRACVVVLNLNSPKGYEYYLWDGTAFAPQADSSIFAADVGYDRSFTHNVTGGNTFHLIFAYRGELLHLWKSHQGGAGAWNQEVIIADSRMPDFDWFPIATVRGDELFLFYCRQTAGGGRASSQVYATRRDPATGAWDAPVQVSNSGSNTNLYPNTAFRVPPTSDYVPVFWTAGSGGGSILFNRAVGLGTSFPDVTPPAAVQNLQAVPRVSDGTVVLNWSAPGDDAIYGVAQGYDIRYFIRPITEDNWWITHQVLGEPMPAEPGTAESMVVSGLTVGLRYYFAVKAWDEVLNFAAVSNSPGATVAQTSAVPGAGDAVASLGANYPNPFNPATVIPFSLSRDGSARLVIYDAAGRLVTELVHDTYAAGDHTARWDGRDRGGREVSSGTYYCVLEFDGGAATRKLSLVR